MSHAELAELVELRPSERIMAAACLVVAAVSLAVGLVLAEEVQWVLGLGGGWLALLGARDPRSARPWATSLVVLVGAGALELVGDAPGLAAALALSGLGLAGVVWRVCRDLNRGPLSVGPRPGGLP